MAAASFTAIARRIAARQHGVVTRAQLRAAGVSPDVIDHRLRSGQIVPLHRGVYLVGVVVPPDAHPMAACLACGSRAVLSHRSAAGLWKIRSAWAGPVEVAITRGYRNRPGVNVYRLSTLQPDEVTRLRGIPVTTPARTVYDLAAVLPTDKIERAASEAIALRLTSLRDLEAMAERQAGRRGSGRLRAALGDGGGPTRTRSTAEERFLRLIRRGEIRAPEANTIVFGYEVDFHWPDRRLVVEIDGLTYHRSPRAVERDRRRDGELAARGILVMRVTWHQIVKQPEGLLVRLASALAVAGRGRAHE